MIRVKLQGFNKLTFGFFFPEDLDCIGVSREQVLNQLKEVMYSVKLLEGIWLNNHDFCYFCLFLVMYFFYVIFSLGYGYTSS